tara:strand:- start:23413 stop:27168 length:3756 start_codon:yes stop_codon:yes gene_type:complete
MFKTLANGPALLALLATATMASACGDGPTCPSEIVVVFQNPVANGNLSNANDSDAGRAGIQSDVTVRSNLGSGDDFTLTVTNSDNAVEQITATSNADGDVTFEGVTFPAGEVTLSVTGVSDDGCGSGTDEVVVTVVTDAACDLTIAEGPIDNEFFAPIPVLNSSNDSDGAIPNFQANLNIASGAGFNVEVFILDVSTGVEASVGTATAGADGTASFAATLAQGVQAVRATCVSGSVNEASATNTVRVDTIVPTCELTVPTNGVTITPDDDTDGDIGNGIQMTWTGTVDDADENDTEGENASFFRDALEFDAIPVDEAGNSASELAEFTSPGNFAVSFVTQDHAGNACSAGFDVPVILDGCAISIDGPAAIVTVDSDADAGNGMQANFTVSVDTACEGETVFVDCGQGESSEVVPSGGLTTVSNVTLDGNASSEGAATCSARVVNSDNFQTSDARDVTWDTEAPGVSLSLVSPATLDCGETLARTVANDADSDLSNGFQITVAVIAPFAATRDVDVINSAGTTTLPAPDLGAPINVELLPGDNDVRARVSDTIGNEASTGGCAIRLEDIDVDFEEPVDDGLLGVSEGTVNGAGALETTVCATVSEPGVVVTVTLDGATDHTTTFAGGEFCTDAPVVFTTGTHTLEAVARDPGTRQGSISISVDVDLTPPAAPVGLVATATDHRTIDFSWDAVVDSTYMVRIGTAPFSTDPTTFVSQGTQWPGAIVNESTTITPLDAGTEYHLGVMAIDAVGNRSTASSIGPVIPDFDGTGAVVAGGSADGDRFGMRLASGDFNGDGFDDVAVASPFANSLQGRVFIYYGSAEGVVTPAGTDITPDVVLEGNGSFEAFGFSLARIDWDGAGDGLAVGAAITNEVYIFHNDTLSVPGVIPANGRDILITLAGTAGDWFTGSSFGYTMTSGQIDAANTPEDLIIAAPTGGSGGGKSATNPGGDGGIVIIYGGTLDAGDTITLSNNASSADMLGLAGLIFENPQDAVNGSQFGERLAYLGDTRAGNGVGDIAVTYVSDTVNDSTDDVIYVLRGRTLLTPGMRFTDFVTGTDLTIVNTALDETPEFGISMGSISDQNGDGFRDIVIGANTQNDPAPSTNSEGRVWIVAGNRVNTIDIANSANYLTQFIAAFSVGRRLGTGIANNALTNDADINGDGLEDLAMSSSRGMFIWYGGSIPTGDVSSNTRDHVITLPTGFSNNHAILVPPTIPAVWAGDVNGDGLADLAWSDWLAGGAGTATGLFEVLFDE